MEHYLAEVANIMKAEKAFEVDQIQSLWSGYGKIVRVGLEGVQLNSAIVKHIILPQQANHPRGWNTNKSHQRKVKSYQVEMNWYQHYADLCDDFCRVPKCYGVKSIGEEQLIILEDLDAAGFSLRKSHLSITEVKLCLSWLANFHAIFLNQSPKGLWKVGTYWHLNTRPDEFDAMDDRELKHAATQIDELLNNCKYQTLVHGDAKVANFCFSKDVQQVAAVDFQYVGGGCGIKDVAYLLGSCLTELECELHENELLDYYFKELKIALDKAGNKFNFSELKNEWTCLYPIACTDFTRFLMGWMPTHQKLNEYSKKQVEKALKLIGK